MDKIAGINGIRLKHELAGEMTSPVINEEKIPKSIQNTRAFGIFTNDFSYIKNELNRHIHTSCTKLRSYGTKCSQIGVMLRTKDFRVFYTKRDLLNPTDFELDVSKVAMDLLEDIYDSSVLYRSTGVTLEKISEPEFEKRKKLGKCFDSLEKRFGKNIVQTGFTKRQKDKTT